MSTMCVIYSPHLIDGWLSCFVVLQAPRHPDQGKVVLHATASPFSEVSLESLQSMCSNNSEAVSTCSLTGGGGVHWS